MRKVYLNTVAAKDALNILTKGGLLEQLSEPTKGIFEFKTTEKGKAALAQYYQLITYFFETKRKGSPLQYIILPLLLPLSRTVSWFPYVQLPVGKFPLWLGSARLQRKRAAHAGTRFSNLPLQAGLFRDCRCRRWPVRGLDCKSD